jgi:hypothetical protein
LGYGWERDSHEEGWERADICGYSDICGFLCIFIVAVMYGWISYDVCFFGVFVYFIVVGGGSLFPHSLADLSPSFSLKARDTNQSVLAIGISLGSVSLSFCVPFS